MKTLKCTECGKDFDPTTFGFGERFDGSIVCPDCFDRDLPELDDEDCV